MGEFDLVEFRRVFKGCYVTTPQAHQLDAVAEYVAALRAENAKLRAALDSTLRIFREETSSGDGIQEDHVDAYEVARAALAGEEVGS